MTDWALNLSWKWQKHMWQSSTSNHFFLWCLKKDRLNSLGELWYTRVAGTRMMLQNAKSFGRQKEGDIYILFLYWITLQDNSRACSIVSWCDYWKMLRVYMHVLFEILLILMKLYPDKKWIFLVFFYSIGWYTQNCL